MTATKFAPPGDAPPKRSRSRSTSSKSRASGMTRAQLRTALDQFVTFINTILQTVAPYDALQPKEVAVLVNALEEQAEKTPRFRRGLEALLTVTSGGSLGLVVGILIGRRLARRRVFGGLSPMVDAMGGIVIESMDVAPSEASEAMDAIMDMMQSMSEGTPSANGNGSTVHESE